MNIAIIPPRNDLADAVLASLNFALGGRFGGSTAARPPAKTPLRAWEIDDAPKTGGDYVVIFLNREDAGTYRIGGVGLTIWRLTVRSVGSVTNVALLLDICCSALEERPLSAGSLLSGALKFGGASEIRQDYAEQSLYYGDIDFTFAF